jgi:hypothetical protein
MSPSTRNTSFQSRHRPSFSGRHPGRGEGASLGSEIGCRVVGSCGRIIHLPKSSPLPARSLLASSTRVTTIELHASNHSSLPSSNRFVRESSSTTTNNIMLVKVAFLAAILILTALGAPEVIIKRGSAPPRQCFENCNTGYGDCVGVGPPSMRMHSPQSFARW